MTSDNHTIEFLAVGDTSPIAEKPASIFDAVRSRIEQSDISFVQVERTFATSGTFQEYSCSPHSCVDPRYLAAYPEVGFDIAGLATNHLLDFGPEAVVETLRRFEDAGIAVLGAGRTIADARRPVIFERGGIRVGLLGYCSILLPQYWATDNRPGAAPFRANTYYSPYDYQPGCPARIVTEPLEADLEAMREDVAALRSQVDVVITSFHWGVHFVPRVVADYQRIGARAAIDAGADIVFGHHPHMLKGIELYKGKPCIYSIGNFAMVSGGRTSGQGNCAPDNLYPMTKVYGSQLGPDLIYRHSDHSNMGAMLSVKISALGVEKVALIPIAIDDRSYPNIAPEGSPEFERIVRFIEWSSEEFGAPFKVVGDEIVLDGGLT